MKMERNTIYCYLKKTTLFLSAVLLAYSCQDEELFNTNETTNPNKEEVLPAPASNEFRFTMSGVTSPLDGLRSQYVLVDRGGNYNNEYYPQLKFTIGDTEPALLIFVREKENENETPVVFSHYTSMTVIDSKYATNEEKAQGKGVADRLELRANIPLPERYREYSFANDFAAGKKKWYVMAIIGFSGAEWSGNKYDSKAYYGKYSSETGDGKFSNIGGTTTRPNLGNTFNLRSVPYISNWQPVKLNAQGAGESLNLQFQPQGSLVQVDIAYNIFDAVEERRFGIISNVLDFSGTYDISGLSIYDKFANRDQSTGYGIPNWVADEPRMKGFKTYYVNDNSELSQGERMFPWDLPSLSDTWTSTWGVNSPEARELTNPGGSVAEFFVQGFNYGTQAVSTPLGSWSVPNLWKFNISSASTVDRLIHVFWGMPRPDSRIQGTPYTYVWTSAYSNAQPEEMFYGYRFFPQTQISEMSSTVFNLRKKIREYNTLIEESTNAGNTEKAEEYRRAKEQFITENDAITKMQTYTRDSTIYYQQLLPEAITKRTQRTQPLLIIHQTNARFAERKISHIQTALTSDLMLTEVIHKQENGENYSLVEIYNPTILPVNLCNYAIARLIPSQDGSYLQYRKLDGTGTDQLTEAAILPLKSVVGGTESPFINSPFSTWNNQIADTDYSGRYYQASHITGSRSLTITTKGMNEGEAWYVGRERPTYQNGNIYLYQHQATVIGASGYVNRRPNTDTMPWWNKLWNTSMYTNFDRRNLLYFYAYADGVRQTDRYAEGTLDYQPGHAFVLLKSNGKGGWQIIDATGPIGRNSMGYFGNYSKHRAWLANHLDANSYFSLSRSTMVNFPALPPYRTNVISNTNEPDDWILQENEDRFTPGTRDTWNRQVWYGASFWLTRTPLDPSWTRYRTNVPDKQ